MKPALTTKKPDGETIRKHAQFDLCNKISRLVTNVSTNEKKFPVTEVIPMQIRVAQLDMRYSDKAI